MTLTGQKTKKQLVTHVNYSSLANCEKKSCIFRERFGIFRSFSKFLCFYSTIYCRTTNSVPWNPVILWNPEWETLIKCVQKVLKVLTYSSLALQPSKCFLHDKYPQSSVQSSCSAYFYTHMPPV